MCQINKSRILLQWHLFLLKYRCHSFSFTHFSQIPTKYHLETCFYIGGGFGAAVWRVKESSLLEVWQITNFNNQWGLWLQKGFFILWIVWPDLWFQDLLIFYSFKLGADLILDNNLFLRVAQMAPWQDYLSKYRKWNKNIWQHLNQAFQSAETSKAIEKWKCSDDMSSDSSIFWSMINGFTNTRVNFIPTNKGLQINSLLLTPYLMDF